MNILTISDLSKSFNNQQIINNLNLHIPAGTIFGLIGKNGAGKTTTMKMILGLLKPDSGYIIVNNEMVKYGQTKTNRYIGYLPDVPEFYNYMTTQQYLKLCGEIIGLSKKEIRERTLKLLDLVGLQDVEKRIGGFSRGMKQRLGIAQALLSKPKLLICDEPTSALDPVGRKEILDILLKIKGHTTVLFSTHVLSDVERICDYVAVLNAGKIVTSGTLSEIKALHGHDQILVEFANTNDLEKFKNSKGIRQYSFQMEKYHNQIIISNRNIEMLYKQILETITEVNTYPLKLEIVEPSLERLFLEVTK